jgi:hypothetical protein
MKQKMIAVFTKLNQVNPVSWLSKKVFFNSPLLTAICSSALQVSFWWFYGNYVVATKSSASRLPITGPMDLGEMSFGFFLWGIFLPLILWYSLSLPRMWNKALSSLCSQEVVECEPFEQVINRKLNNTYFLPSVIISLAVTYFYMTVSIPAEIATGRVSFWFVTPFGKIMIALYVGLNSIVFINFALRTLILILNLRHYFKTYGIKVIHIYHVDKCGGFAPIGNLAMRIASLAVAAGVWATWYALLPLTATENGKFYLNSTVILLYLAYAILVPLLLISLTRPVSQAMKRYKQEIVMQVSRTLQEELKSLVVKKTGTEKIDAVLNVLTRMEEYQKLNALYDHLSAMPESPIRSINLKRFSGFASIPAIVGMVSFLADFFSMLSWLQR